MVIWFQIWPNKVKYGQKQIQSTKIQSAENVLKRYIIYANRAFKQSKTGSPV